MTDHHKMEPLPDAESERIVTDAFAAFREVQRETVAAPELQAVYAGAAARTRRRAYLSGLAAAAVLVLVAGSAALLTGIGKTERTPSADDSPTRTVSESPSAPASTPSRTPDDKPTRSSPGAPRGIRDIDLRNITVRLEPLGGTGCGGSVTFRGGTANTGGCVWKIAGGGVKYANLDGVAGEEAVTTIGAGPPNAEYTNGVIAFRSVATGGVESIGYVYVADNSSQIVQAFWVGDSGAVTVQIQDISWDPQQPQTQDRTYRWGGSAFGQIGGPTAFPSPSPEPTGSEPEPSPTPSGE